MDLFKILKLLKTAPGNQIDEHWMKKINEFSGNEEELIKLFEEIFLTNDFETSSFVRSMVDKYYTNQYLVC